MINHLWQHIVQSATMGLNRSPLEPDNQNDFTGMMPVPEEPEARMLQLAGTIAIARKAGYQPFSSKDVITFSKPEAETHRYISHTSAQILGSILNGNSKELLGEFLSLCQHTSSVITPEHLPKLFNWALHARLSGEFILGLSGKRGIWLAKQNSEWSRLLPPSGESWESGTPEERIAYFAWQRQHSPTAAIATLALSYEDETPAFLAKIIPLMARNASPQDLELLEQLHRHSRKEVRKAASHVLAHIRESALVDRMKTAAARIISLKKGFLSQSLEIQVPDKLTQNLQDDGITDDPLPGIKLGRKAVLVSRILETIPPSFWENSLELQPDRLLKLAAESEWAAPVLYGWATATVRYQDESWATEIFRLMADTTEISSASDRSTFAELIPKDIRVGIMKVGNLESINQILERVLRRFSTNISYPTPFILMGEIPFQVAPETAMTFAKKLEQILSTQGNRVDYRFRTFVYELAGSVFSIPPALYQSIANTWGTNPYDPRWYDPYLERALIQLEFRHRMQKSFQG